MSKQKYEINLRKLDIGEPINVGDFWLSWTGDFHRVDRNPGFFKRKLTTLHCEHYRVEELKLPTINVSDELVKKVKRSHDRISKESKKFKKEK